jgi:large subunit ribosomal protein L24
MKVKVGDNVRILAGKDKGKEGRVIRTLKKDNKVVVEGINMVKKHVKPNRMNEVGSIVDIEAPIHASNVKLAETKKEAKKATVKPVEEKATKKTTKKSEKKAS